MQIRTGECRRSPSSNKSRTTLVLSLNQSCCLGFGGDFFVCFCFALTSSDRKWDSQVKPLYPCSYVYLLTQQTVPVPPRSYDQTWSQRHLSQRHRSLPWRNQGPVNNHRRVRLVLPQKGAFLLGTSRSPAWLTPLNSIKEGEVQSLLWSFQPYFIHPLKISAIFEILYDTHPLLGVCIFEFAVPLLKCFSFWKTPMHLSTLKSPPPWSLLCLALVWDPAGARSAHCVSWFGFFSLSQMCWYHAPVSLFLTFPLLLAMCHVWILLISVDVSAKWSHL